MMILLTTFTIALLTRAQSADNVLLLDPSNGQPIIINGEFVLETSTGCIQATQCWKLEASQREVLVDPATKSVIRLDTLPILGPTDASKPYWLTADGNKAIFSFPNSTVLQVGGQVVVGDATGWKFSKSGFALPPLSFMPQPAPNALVPTDLSKFLMNFNKEIVLVNGERIRVADLCPANVVKCYLLENSQRQVYVRKESLFLLNGQAIIGPSSVSSTSPVWTTADGKNEVLAFSSQRPMLFASTLVGNDSNLLVSANDRQGFQLPGTLISRSTENLTWSLAGNPKGLSVTGFQDDSKQMPTLSATLPLRKSSSLNVTFHISTIDRAKFLNSATFIDPTLSLFNFGTTMLALETGRLRPVGTTPLSSLPSWSTEFDKRRTNLEIALQKIVENELYKAQLETIKAALTYVEKEMRSWDLDAKDRIKRTTSAFERLESILSSSSPNSIFQLCVNDDLANMPKIAASIPFYSVVAFKMLLAKELGSVMEQPEGIIDNFRQISRRYEEYWQQNGECILQNLGKLIAASNRFSVKFKGKSSWSSTIGPIIGQYCFPFGTLNSNVVEQKCAQIGATTESYPSAGSGSLHVAYCEIDAACTGPVEFKQLQLVNSVNIGLMKYRVGEMQKQVENRIRKIDFFTIDCSDLKVCKKIGGMTTTGVIPPQAVVEEAMYAFDCPSTSFVNKLMGTFGSRTLFTLKLLCSDGTISPVLGSALDEGDSVSFSANLGIAELQIAHNESVITGISWGSRIFGSMEGSKTDAKGADGQKLVGIRVFSGSDTGVRASFVFDL